MTEIRNLFVAMLLFSGVIVGMSIFYVDLTSPANLAYYGMTPTQIANITPEDLATRNVTNLIINQTDEIEAALRQSPTNPLSAVDVAWGYINAGLSAVTLPFNALWILQNMVISGSSIIGIPGWVVGMIIAIITIIVAFTIMSAYLKWPI